MLAVVAPLPLIGAPASISPQTLEDDLAVNREEVAVPDHGSAVIPTKGGDRQRLRVEISHAPVSALANMEYQGCSAVSTSGMTRSSEPSRTLMASNASVAVDGSARGCWSEGIWVGIELGLCGFLGGKAIKLAKVIGRIKSIGRKSKRGPKDPGGPGGNGSAGELMSLRDQILGIIGAFACADFMSSVKDLVNCIIDEIFAYSPRLRHPLDQLQGEWVQSEVAT